jgi:hypothetical protein
VTGRSRSWIFWLHQLRVFPPHNGSGSPIPGRSAPMDIPFGRAPAGASEGAGARALPKRSFIGERVLRIYNCVGDKPSYAVDWSEAPGAAPGQPHSRRSG